MDAVKFTNEAMRMCNEYWSKCWGCPAGDGVSCRLGSGYKTISAEEKVSIVERWAAKHPAKTRQSEFLKLFPGAEPMKDGVLAICPKAFSPEYKDKRGLCKWHYADCDNCCRQFWSAEVEE